MKTGYDMRVIGARLSSRPSARHPRGDHSDIWQTERGRAWLRCITAAIADQRNDPALSPYATHFRAPDSEGCRDYCVSVICDWARENDVPIIDERGLRVRP